MVKSNADVVQFGPDRIRIGPWRGEPRTAHVAPVIGRPTAPATVTRCLDLLAARGYERIFTSALSVAEQEPFLEAGFTVHERLHLLRHPLDTVPDAPAHRLRRGHRFDLDRVLAIDALAFEPFWRFDRRSIADARSATPTSRFRVSDGARPTGYAITGRAGPVGYLQRLAVHPDHQGKGIGSALVVDAIRWVRGRGATSLLVNTQEVNTGALRLYEHLGFERQEHGLAVLEYAIRPGAAA